MRTSRKIFLALVLTLVVAAVLSVCAFAALDFETDLPTGVTRDQEGWVNSGYADVDTEDGWYLMTGTDYSATETSFPTFVEMASCQFYWNKTTGEAVWVVTSNNMSSNYGEETEKSVVNASADYKKSLYAYAASFVDITGTSGNVYATTFAKDGAVDAYSTFSKMPLPTPFMSAILVKRSQRLFGQTYTLQERDTSTSLHIRQLSAMLKQIRLPTKLIRTCSLNMHTITLPTTSRL